MDFDRLAGLEIGLNHLAVRLVGWTRWTPPTASTVGTEPHVPSSDRKATGVVRFSLHFVQYFPGLPVDPEDTLRYLIADPQAVRGCFQCIRVEIGRLEQPLDSGSTRRNGRRLSGRALLRVHTTRRDHPGDQRRSGADEISTSDLHRCS